MPEQIKPFGLNLAGLKPTPKPAGEATLRALDRVGEGVGFVSREPQAATGAPPVPAPETRGRGRPRGIRTGQVHAKVLPDVAHEISAEATRRGVTQGALIEEAWALYKERGR
ncbi:hypothetical protein [Niveispirillum fermenti]|uniref:hypothetical protein n=1 Tax=Niveispirillum fermenti TaxID=1233113 RepID=UPI003A8A6BB4